MVGDGDGDGTPAAAPRRQRPRALASPAGCRETGGPALARLEGAVDHELLGGHRRPGVEDGRDECQGCGRDDQCGGARSSHGSSLRGLR
ncbi:hypothetical protein SERN_1215 [Serinibacter arcticus]|uniref:Uncharacterized protein n=1 Tax=Serinibacter arcticus TaxID=1655435 RepID=A0A4Z1E6K1_9MICO|nr:hypothetical protein SERN_1215 [Serinibacter arcticus]